MGGPKRLYRTSAVLVGLALVTAGSGCSWFSPDDDVAVVGDSITVFMGGQLFEQDPDDQWDIRAQNGRTATEMAGPAGELSGTEPDQAVINLGTNDALQQVPIDTTTASLTLIMEAFAEARCVHFVTISTALPPRGDPPAADTARAINDWIRTVADERDNVSIIDWNARLQRDDGAAQLLIKDRIHPNNEGKKVLAEMIVDAVNSC